jgi:FAD/FMN-containing dehydrogenase
MYGVGEPVFDEETGKYLVAVQAGIRLKTLVTSLAAQTPSLGLVNLGTIKKQSIAGATATGTHGTGITIGNLATQIEAITLVTGIEGAPPRVIPKANDYFPAVVGNYSDMLTFPVRLIPHHWECEYAVPMNNAKEALNALKTVLDESEISLLLPLEIRFVARDNFLLSPAANDPRYPQSNGVCYIGAMTDKNATEVFQRFEPLMKQFGGRPHWGKHFTLTRNEMRDMYPGSYDDFNNIRKDLDPKGIFTNSLIHQLFDA